MPEPIPHTPPAPVETGPELPTYRSVSGLAVFGLLFGLVSPIALIAPPLWLVPVIGIALSLLGLRETSRSESQLVGRRVALIGLLLSIIFGVAGPARYIVRETLVANRARAFADAWLEHMRAGRIYAAHQMTRPPRSRMPLDDSLIDLYQNDAATRDAFRAFSEQRPVNALLDNREWLAVRFVTLGVDRSGQRRELFGLLYEVDVKQGDQTTQIPVYIVLALSDDTYTGDEQWHIANVFPGAEAPK